MKCKLAVCGVVVLSMLAIATIASAEEDGKALFDAKCAMCHGKDGVAKTMAKGSGNFNDVKWQQEMTVEKIMTVATDGKNKMKGFKDKLTPEQIKAIAAYVKSLK